MEQKNINYLNIALGIAVIAGLFLLFRTISSMLPQKPLAVAPDAAKKAMPGPAGAAVQTAQVMTANPSDMRSLGEVYANFPAQDAGENMVEAWSRVKPEDKAKFYEGIDKEIGDAKTALAQNPSDKKAKHMLFIAETMKKMADDNFDYKIPGKAKEAI